MSSADALPEPLVGADVDLRDFAFMPLEIARLRRSKSWLLAKRNPAIAFYMINLWTGAWHERPAASLEDDDDVLADIAGCSPEKWEKVRNDVLRGWVKCSDGRLYHPVVAEKVLEAWASKIARKSRTAAARTAKSQGKSAAPTEHATTSVTTSVTDNATGHVTGLSFPRKGQGEGQGESERQTAVTAEEGKPDFVALGEDCIRALGGDPSQWLGGYLRLKAVLDEGHRPDAILAAARDIAAKPGFKRPDQALPYLLKCLPAALAKLAVNPATGGDFGASNDGRQWQARVKGWAKSGFWLTDQWGAAPDDPGTLVPKAVMTEFATQIAAAKSSRTRAEAI